MWDNFKSFMAQPFKSEGTALDWFLFLGFLILVMAVWRIILTHIIAMED